MEKQTTSESSRLYDIDDAPEFICKGCGFHTLYGYEYYMVTNEIWLQANDGSRKGMLCIGCVEKRIGRKLNQFDFLDAPINDIDLFPLKSRRLISRLTSFD